MDRTNLDDPSGFYGLGHSAFKSAGSRNCRRCHEEIGVRDTRDVSLCQRCGEIALAEREAYVIEHDIKGKAIRLIGYYEALGMRKRDAEEAGIERFLRLASGVYERMWKFIDAGHELDAAILESEAELTKEADIEARASQPDGERPAKDAYLGDSVTNLMDAHLKTHGGSRSSKKGRKPKSSRIEKDSRYQELLAQADTRPAMVSGRVSERVQAFLRDDNAPASAGEIVEVVVDAMIQSGCTLSVIQEWLASGIAELSKGDAA